MTPGSRHAGTSIIGAAAVALLLALAACGSAEAKRLVVKNTHPHGKGSFAHAVKRANRTQAKDKIVLPGRLRGAIHTPDVSFDYAVAIKGTGEEPGRIRHERGPDVAMSFKKGTNALRNLDLGRVRVYSEAAGLTVADTRLGGSDKGHGAGISAFYRPLTVNRSVIRGFGSGIYNVSGYMTVQDSELTGNEDGIEASGYRSHVYRSTLDRNGVGVYLHPGGSASVVDSTVSEQERALGARGQLLAGQLDARRQRSRDLCAAPISRRGCDRLFQLDRR